MTSIETPEWGLVFVGFITFGVVGWQAILMRRHAEHLGKMASIMGDTAKRQLRAYLAVTIGAAGFQERRSEEDGGDLRFECRPNLLNTGQTPARKIKFRARAAVLPYPLPKGTYLPEETNLDDGDSILGSQQSATMYAVVDGFCADNEVQRVKEGFHEKALYVWGLITYEDVFGETHFTRFCQHVYWMRNNEVRGFYMPDRNNAD